LAAAQDFVIPKIHDIAYHPKDLVTFYWLNKHCRSTKFKSGEYVHAPVLDVVTDNSVELAIGTEPIPTETVQEFDRVKLPWHLRAQPVVMTLKDRKMIAGNGPNRVFDMWAAKLKSAAKSLRKKVANDILNNTSTTAGKYVGLKYACSDYGGTVDVTSYGGITIGAADDTLDPVEDATNTTLTLTAMEDLWVKLDGETQFIVTTPTLFGKYWGKVQPQQRFTDGDLASAGFKNLMFNSAPVTFDRQVPTKYMYYLSAGSDDEKYMYFFVHPEFDFAFENTAETLPNQAISVARFYFGGQLLVPGRNRQGCFSLLAG